MTKDEFLIIINKNNIDYNDLSVIIDAYCLETKRSHDDFTKIMQIILHIPEFQSTVINNTVNYFKYKYNIVSLDNINGKHYFYTSLI
jgi:hypothetical protein